MELGHFSSIPSNFKGIQEKDLDDFSGMEFLEEINTTTFHEIPEQKHKKVTNSELDEHNSNQITSSFLLPSSSLEILRNYGSRFKKLQSTNTIQETCLDQQKKSTEEIIRFAGARYVQYSAHWNDNFFIQTHPYGLFDLGNLSEEENRDIGLVQFLLAAAEKVGSSQFNRANSLLSLLRSQFNSSSTSNHVERVVFHFARALQERINKETGRVQKNGIGMKSQKNEEVEMLQKMDTKISLVCHQKVPFNQVMQFAAVQTIVEHVASKSRVHLIDLEIRSGVQCTALMQALVQRQDCKLEFMKITAVGFVTSKSKIEETGKRLATFAESLKLRFSYKAVTVTDFAEITETDFEIEEEEAVAVYSAYILRTLISNPNSMEKFMCVLRNIKPSIMVVLEVEANHNSPSFVNRFVEALFFYATFFDCIEMCMKEEDECRMVTELVLSAGIKNIVANEGRERTVRNVKIDVWRRFFARYRMVETGFSDSSLYHAELVSKEFVFEKFCTLNKHGKSLIVGWKGTPMHSISAWRFL